MDRTRGSERAIRGWTEERAERQLRSLELFGMRFGLDRMRRMMTALGSPERRFESIQVLGTNGKSSTTRMLAAILARHGLRIGAYTSPHLVSYRERVLIDGHELGTDAFAESIARASAAAERVNRTLSEDDHVTQFELLTAAALWQMAEQDVDVAVVEAGLGGRYDATSVIDPRVSVLTNVGLEHTRWLGPTIADIAAEKLAAVPTRAILVLGEQLASEAAAVAERVATAKDARVVHPRALEPEIEPLAQGAFQRANFALARAAAEAYLEQAGIVASAPAIAAAARTTAVPGRLQRLAGEPPTILDGAHNPHAVRALVAALSELHDGGPLALVLGVLDDKDAAEMLTALLPICAHAWFTAPPSGRALSPAALESLARQLGFTASDCEPRPERALAQAQAWAQPRGATVLATGSVYLVGELLGSRARGECSQAVPGRSGGAAR
ncbi:MAG TPA: cyanophycin synthetase [Solirubrobacteraceae bacterium]|jgi:dihydrofolate synthase/folylpolyglutamate synthase